WHNVVFAEYAMWWKDRLNYNFTSQLKSSNFPIYFKKDDKYSYGYEFGSEKRWQEARRPLTIPFSKKLRKWHWRDSLYNFESWRGKVKR
ncbi:MAG: hypothetical protein SVM86_05305, partial [Candidatus Cloacimonadota bacterium]|nr:hypothetical protein [Candidatus Cloacimonadota bacterium]